MAEESGTQKDTTPLVTQVTDSAPGVYLCLSDPVLFLYAQEHFLDGVQKE